jgi:hypothetical protein
MILRIRNPLNDAIDNAIKYWALYRVIFDIEPEEIPSAVYYGDWA